MFVELPQPGSSVSKGSSFGNVESVKATSDVNSPISGEVVEVNPKLTEAPGLVILITTTLFIFHHVLCNDPTQLCIYYPLWVQEVLTTLKCVY